MRIIFLFLLLLPATIARAAPDDAWQPTNLPWDHRPPEPPTDAKCLTSTVAPLTATPDTTPPPPPQKGCPAAP